jgi:hypothetical protein
MEDAIATGTERVVSNLPLEFFMYHKLFHKSWWFYAALRR